MDLPTSFSDFLADIRLKEDERKELRVAHTELRQRLVEFSDTKDLVSSTFIQGSYRRATIVQPPVGKRVDVDVIAVTRINRDITSPEAALKKFIPFMDHYYPEQYELQGRSIGIELDKVDLDLVITTPQDESTRSFFLSDAAQDIESVEEGVRLLTEARAARSLGPLYLPDRDVKRWTRTHPVAQLEYTWQKNADCNGHFVNVVKALKWWRRRALSSESSVKSYPFERIIGECCPVAIRSVAEGVVTTLEQIVSSYQYYRQMQTVPELKDHGVPEHNVLKRVTGTDFAEFYDCAVEAAKLARAAFDSEVVDESRRLWHSIFGDPFPRPSPSGHRGGFSERTEKSNVGKSDRFA